MQYRNHWPILQCSGTDCWCHMIHDCQDCQYILGRAVDTCVHSQYYTNNVNSWFFRHVALYSIAALKCVLAAVSKHFQTVPKYCRFGIMTLASFCLNNYANGRSPMVYLALGASSIHSNVRTRNVIVHGEEREERGANRDK